MDSKFNLFFIHYRQRILLTMTAADSLASEPTKSLKQCEKGGVRIRLLLCL